VSQGQPLGKGRAVVIMVHGRNATPRNILDLVPRLGHPELTYLAPAAAGGTWYPLSFMSEIPKNEPGISSGIAVIHDLIAEALEQGIPSERIMLLGFSQGACLASTAVQRRPARYGGLVVLSGGLIGPAGTTWTTSGSFEGTPVFLGCSDVDAHIPRQRVAESADVFRKADAEVTERIYPGMGHTINEDELEFTRGLLASVAM
jgi:predicted esterase